MTIAERQEPEHRVEIQYTVRIHGIQFLMRVNKIFVRHNVCGSSSSPDMFERSATIKLAQSLMSRETLCGDGLTSLQGYAKRGVK